MLSFLGLIYVKKSQSKILLIMLTWFHAMCTCVLMYILV